MSFASLSSWVVERFLSADFRICEDIPLKLLVTKFFTAASWPSSATAYSLPANSMKFRFETSSTFLSWVLLIKVRPTMK
jgi:hypothetical protein